MTGPHFSKEIWKFASETQLYKNVPTIRAAGHFEPEVTTSKESHEKLIGQK